MDSAGANKSIRTKRKKKKKKLHVENKKTINSQLQARLSHTEHVHTSSSQHSGKINKNIFTQLDAISTAVFKIDKERDRSATRTGKRRSSREVIAFGIYGESASKCSKTYRQFFFFFRVNDTHTHRHCSRRSLYTRANSPLRRTHHTFRSASPAGGRAVYKRRRSGAVV